MTTDQHKPLTDESRTCDESGRCHGAPCAEIARIRELEARLEQVEADAETLQDNRVFCDRDTYKKAVAMDVLLEGDLIMVDGRAMRLIYTGEEAHDAAECGEE